MDPISSVISTIINAQRQNYRDVTIKPNQGAGSTVIKNLLQRLQREGYIEAVSFINNSFQKSKSAVFYNIRLKYNSDGKPAISSFFRVSKSSRRVYIKAASLWQPQTTVGTLIVSTSFGLRSDRSARRLNVGGEVIGGLR